MPIALISLLAGIVFGAGLAVSQMINPAKVLAFLDLGGLAAGAWDPSLALVMGGALAVTAAGYAIARRLGHPLFGQAFALPTRRDVDARLIAGAAVFGLGWGLAGYCPGPAIASLVAGAPGTVVFLAAMVAGMGVHRLLEPSGAAAPGAAASPRG